MDNINNLHNVTYHMTQERELNDITICTRNLKINVEFNERNSDFK